MTPEAKVRSTESLLRREIFFFGGLSFAALAVGNFSRKFLTIGRWMEVQFFVSYQDLGFIKRGVVGSLFRGLNVLPDSTNTFVFSLAVSLGVVFAYWRFVAACFDTGVDRRPIRILFLVFAVSPATFMNFGYNLGRYDQIGVLLLLLSIWGLMAGRVFWVGLLSGLGVLIHEAYVLLFLPLVLAIAWERLDLFGRGQKPGQTRGHGKGRIDRGRLSKAVLLLGPTILATFAVYAAGQYEPGHEALVSHFERVSPEHAGSRGINVWSRTLGDNVAMTMERLRRPGELYSLALAASLLALFASFYFAYRRANGLPGNLVFWSPFVVLCICSISLDFYRWFSICIFNMTIAMSYLSSSADRDTGRAISIGSEKLAWLLVATALLGPLGVGKLFPAARNLATAIFD